MNQLLTNGPGSPRITAFIGGGNMARSLIGGLIADGFDPAHIIAADPVDDTRADLGARMGIKTSAENTHAADQADILVMAVKPQMLRAVAEGIAASVQNRKPLVISIAAGVRSDDLERWLGGDVAVVRTMPNTPALVQSGATALFANPRVRAEQRDLAESILRAVGITRWVNDESLIDAVTALSGSGPAYFFLVMEAMQAAGEKLGLDSESARLLTLQTAFGAAKMALESREAPADLRKRVTSPGGTTERALGVMEDEGLRATFEKALAAARDRSEELAGMMSGSDT
ncbi:MAG: pyrroline-5-carboxylate reductase [Gammaproteobacteria bacterium]